MGGGSIIFFCTVLSSPHTVLSNQSTGIKSVTTSDFYKLQCIFRRALLNLFLTVTYTVVEVEELDCYYMYLRRLYTET